MIQSAIRDDYGVVAEPGTLTIRRNLPGPVERIWAYLTESDLRRLWLASGVMDMRVGAQFELAWDNNHLTDPPGQPPEGFDGKHRMESEITELDPPRKLAFSWGSTGGVVFELEPRGDDVLLIVTHRRIADPSMRLNISAGWHAHLDVLAARVAGGEPEPFWDHWAALKTEYARRLTA